MLNPDSELARRFWEHGRLDDCPVIDFHGHMQEWRSCYMPRESAEGMLKTMDECNVRLLLFCGHLSLHGICSKHQFDIDAVRRHPDRFRSYFAINGNSPDLKGDLKRFMDNQDVFIGFKTLADYFKIKITDDRYQPFFEYANANKLPFLCHTWGNSAMDGHEEAARFMGKYPDIVFIAGHSFHSCWDEGAKLCADFPNLYLELTAVFDERGPLEILLEKAGSKRLLFGTDLPWFDTHHGIGTLLSTDMTDDDRHNILHRNGERILGVYPWFQKLRKSWK